MTQEKDKTTEDLELESAIGDVFKQFDMGDANAEGETEHHDEEDIKDDEHDDLNFDDAINDAFQSLHESRQGLGHSHTDEEGPAASPEGPSEIQQSGDVYENENLAPKNKDEGDEVDELDLENAIKSAIQSIHEPVRHDIEDDKDESDHLDHPISGSALEDEIIPDADRPELHHYSPLEIEKDEEFDDLELQNAIGNAFESIKEKRGDSVDENLQKAISQSLQSVVMRDKADPDNKVNVDSIVSEVVSQATQDDANIISEDMLQELAKEITTKVHRESENLKEKSKPLAMPKIDDNVLDHFVNEANRDLGDEGQQTTEPSLSNDELQATIASAVKNALETENKGDNLDQLQMNDILTNAFNMAMEHPNELLNNLETDESRLDKLKQKDGKKLTIAETLALHRSNMKSDLRPELNSQLSSVLSNLSARFSNLESDQNLLSVIKKMTSFLTNSNVHNFSNSQSLISTFTSYKHNGLEEIFINSLNLAKEYSRQNDKLKAIGVIDNVLALFGRNSTNDVLDYNFNLVTLINNSIISTISNFSNLKTFKNSIFDKPKVNSPEYKERIRLENRERKKKWREINSERNKDNDLRSRVLKRANLMYGEQSSQEKSNWVEEEFNRRRERRIAKQSKNLDDKTSTPGELSNNETYINDKNLIQIVGDFFDVFSNFSPKDDPETGLYTTSIAMSCAGIVYLIKVNSNLEVKRIDAIITAVVSNLINSFTSLDQQERILYLSKGSSLGQLKDLNYSSKLTDQGLASYINSRSPGQSSASSILSRISSTVRELTSSDESNKRLKLSSNMILDQHRPGWPSAANLKFPSYKGNDTASSTLGKEPTPFISNKIGVQQPSESSPGLKKPGAFQRPSYAKPDRGKGLGFPAHATIKQNNS